MVEYMTPWRPDQVLDIRYNRASDHVEFRWCPDEHDPSTLLPESQENNLCTDCELLWSGNLKERIS